MRVALYLIVLSTLAAAGGAAAGTRSSSVATEMKQLTLADVNQATEQQEMPAVRLVRQLGAGRRFFPGRFGPGGGGGPFGGRFGGGGFRRPFGGGGRRFNGPPSFFPPPPPRPFGFFG
ncbi:hypothetical protein KR222_004824 [Zaprionus bogoriensis]|nr:hypothetical protein KR222_004824 [Zaprionus bogoriensis]